MIQLMFMEIALIAMLISGFIEPKTRRETIFFNVVVGGVNFALGFYFVAGYVYFCIIGGKP